LWVTLDKNGSRLQVQLHGIRQDERVKSNNRRLASGEILEVGRCLEKREEGGEVFHDDGKQHPFALPLAYKRNPARERDMSVTDR